MHEPITVFSECTHTYTPTHTHTLTHTDTHTHTHTHTHKHRHLTMLTAWSRGSDWKKKAKQRDGEREEGEENDEKVRETGVAGGKDG